MSEPVQQRHDPLCAHKDARSSAGPPMPSHWFFRGGGRLRRLFAAPFVLGCLAALALAAMFHAPTVAASSFSVPIFYFTTRPAFVWFGMLLPFVLVGALAMSRRWFAVGLAFWALSWLTCEEPLAWVRPFHGSAREKFESAQMAYLSISKAHDKDVEVMDVPLRIVDWNFCAGTLGAAQAVAQLATLRPDIAVFEEFEFGGHDTMIDAFRASPYFRPYHLVRSPATHDLAILSRFPVTWLQNELLTWKTSVWQVHFAPDRRVTFVVVHLSKPELKTQVLRGWTWQGLRMLSDARREELQGVRETLGVQVDGSPVLLAGDFNVPSHYPDLAIATAGMNDAFLVKGFGWGKTAPAVLRAARPDMIFLPKEATVFDAFAVPTRNSTHCPFVAEVSIPIPRLEPAKPGSPGEDLLALPEEVPEPDRTPQPAHP